MITPDVVKADDKTGFTNNKLIDHFGSTQIDDDLLNRIKKICGVDNLHPLLSRGMVFSHRDLDKFLDDIEQGKKVYIYTGRGPSTTRMHLGHLVPFMLTKYLQDLFKCDVYIQITDDEKYLLKGKHSLREYTAMGHENIRDIIACGFDMERTFIFVDTEVMSNENKFYVNLIKIMKNLTCNQIRACFGVEDGDNLGKMFFPALQMVPSFATTFGMDKNVRCLIPCGIDQDPYFRLVRDVAKKMKFKKPVVIHTNFLPSLKGRDEKMSASDESSAIYLDDTHKKIKKKINKAFSGGRETTELHKKLGGVPEIDVAFQYLKCFIESDESLKEIEDKYRKGEMSTGELKKICCEIICNIVDEHKQKRV